MELAKPDGFLKDIAQNTSPVWIIVGRHWLCPLDVVVKQESPCAEQIKNIYCPTVQDLWVTGKEPGVALVLDDDRQ